MSRSAAPRESAAQRPLSLLLQIYSVHARMAELVERELAREAVEASGYAALSLIGASGPVTSRSSPRRSERRSRRCRTSSGGWRDAGTSRGA